MPKQEPTIDPGILENLAVVILSGGGGGALLAEGFAAILPDGNLTVIANTGDDFQHLGLTVCPDLDSVMYRLAGESNLETGWGRANESWRTLEEVSRLGGPDWFRLGDLDLATHLVRSHRLSSGERLTEATAYLSERFGVVHQILPMSDDPAPTLIETSHGLLPFQNWFVEQRWQPAVVRIALPEDVPATREVISALEKADLLVLAPSNPFVSLDPILNVYPVRTMITDFAEAVFLVSPIVEGKAVKGPTAKMMDEMGYPVTPVAVADYYDGLFDVFVYDTVDEGTVSANRYETFCTNTIMKERTDRIGLAEDIVTFMMEQHNR